MQSATWRRRASWLGLFGIAVLVAGSAWADDDKPAEEKAPAAQKEPPVKVPIDALSLRPHEARFWLQMQVVSVPPALRDQLDLKDQGVLVAHVRRGGPADKGGIKENDILLSAGEKPIKDLTEFVGILNASEGKELSIKLLRAGKAMTVSVTPVERTKIEPDFFAGPHPFGDVDFRDMEKAIKEKLKRAGVDLRVQFIQPGKIFPPGARLGLQTPEFPDDLTVNIHKEGNKPADIELKRGDKTWTAKEDDLAPLPEDVREPIEALLGKNTRGIMLRLAHLHAPPHPPGPPRAEGPEPDGPDHGPGDRPPRPEGPDGGRGRRPPGPPRAEGPGPDGPGQGPGRPNFHPRLPQDQQRLRDKGSLERRLDALSRGLEEMHREFDGLRKSIREQDRPRDDKDEADDIRN